MPVGDVKSEAVGTAARYNDGKPDFSLVPLIALEECAKVFDYGRRKYSEWNWLKGQDWSHPYASLLRHLSAWHQGEEIDPESGLPHLGHAMCNMVMLSTFAKTYPQGDNRPNKRYFKSPKGEESTTNEKEVTPIGDKDTSQVRIKDLPEGLVSPERAARIKAAVKSVVERRRLLDAGD